MAAEFTTVAMTYNLWGRHLWPRREPALRSLFATRDADLVAVQELCPETRVVLDELLPAHARVDDDFPGWTSASNIWWRTDLYRLEDYGAEDVGITGEARRLFWVKLTPLLLDGGGHLLFCTAHYTWPGHPQEELTGTNPRIRQAERTVEVLDRLAPHGTCLFVGDLNDDHHPVRILRRAGFRDSFSVLGRTSPFTSPVSPLTRPEGNDPPKDVPKVIDYQFHRGPIRVRNSEVADFFVEGTAPSDHKPVVATYTLGSGGASRSGTG